MLDRLPARRTDIAPRRTRLRPVRALLAAGTAVVLPARPGPTSRPEPGSAVVVSA
ncbi:hypothetical protein [Pseudonocardia ammonioxydans]|uniref:hypothetical protein n=1 Tax=Pseudonocardia ammonioxydans TaxID=260086 RepID=UPI0015A5A08C|nr:hypothetical protein [Pseudonocardia ammonioxydans]